MLLQNGYSASFGSLRFFGAGTINGAYPNIAQNIGYLTGQQRNIFMGDADIDPKSSIPDGTRHPVAWQMPQKAGGLSCRNNVYGSGTLVASALAVKLAEADLTGTGELDAIGGLVVQLLADLIGSGEISDADLKAFLQAVASLTGSGVAAGTRTGIGALISALTGDGTAETSVATGTGELDADLVVTGTGLTTGNVGAAVWAALAAANNVSGTMGEKLNDAGSGSNPWTEVIESGFTAAEILRILAAVLAGKVSGAGSGTETFVGIDGTTDRVVSTVDTSGNRTSVTLDGS